MIIKSIQELKDQISKILSKHLFEEEMNVRQEKIKFLLDNNSMDYQFTENNVLRIGLNSAFIYEILKGSMWTIPNGLITIFSIFYRQVNYSDLLSIKSGLADIAFGPNTKLKESYEGDIEYDYQFIANFTDLWIFCNLIDHAIFSKNINRYFLESDDMKKLLLDPDSLNTDLILDWLSNEFNINDIQAICISSLKSGEKYY